MKVIGTAGHVDHGKSTLVLALTGIDPDRLAEEKAREMTIDLGFAWMTLADGEAVGIIDVPGHIDFIKNMLAGVGGIDAALFVIAADEGVMPQTREHLAILDLLEVQAGVVALTKIDMVDYDPDWLELVQADVADALEGTVLGNAPIVPVSARTGEGVEELKRIIAATLAGTPERRDVGRPRLPVDRAFSVAGFGTVVTGTLSDGPLEVGQEVEVVPAGVKARVRGLQTHKHKIERAVPGSRVAINLSGVGKEQVNRGDVVGLPGALTPTVLVDVRLRTVADAPKELGHNQPVSFFSGAAEVAATTRLLDAEVIRPGESGWVQLRLAEPVVVQRGDRFILRQPSPSRTIGGGVIVNPFPGRRWRRFRPDVIEMLEALASGETTAIVYYITQRAGPASFAVIMQAAGLEQQETLDAVRLQLADGRLVALDRGLAGSADLSDAQLVAVQTLMTTASWRDLGQRIQRAVASYHRQYPLRQGMPREEIKSRIQSKRRPLAPRTFNDMLAQAVADDLIVDEGALIRLPDHQVRLSASQQDNVDSLLRQFEAAPYSPPSVADSMVVVGEDVFLWLVDSGQLVRVSDDVVFSPAGYDALVAGIVEHLSREETITVAQVRDIFNTSRKYALALLEYLDARRVTRRVGDARVLRKPEL